NFFTAESLPSCRAESAFFVQRQSQRKAASLALDALDVHAAAMQVSDFLHHRKSQTEAVFGSLGTRRILLIEAGPDFLDVFRRNADAVVCYGQLGFLPLAPQDDADMRLAAAVFESVVDEVVYQPRNQALVGGDKDSFFYIGV